MNTISIHVPNTLASIYERAPEEQKKKAELYINAWLSSFLSGQSPDEQLSGIMKGATEIARKNGLTPEILAKLLRDEA